ncbi:MAG: hypothetical protein JWP37_3327 [Mucilaginibacter sp.]|nr:hypothetical protein [Mucilaginibacter sp.]
MEENTSPVAPRTVFNISKIAEYTTYVIAVGLIYSIAKMYFYYILLLHVPIFQYVDTTELILSFPTVIFLILYAGPLFVANYIGKSRNFNKEEKLFFIPLLYAFIVFLFIVGKNNDPVVQQFWLLPIKYWKYGYSHFYFIYM